MSVRACRLRVWSNNARMRRSCSVRSNSALFCITACLPPPGVWYLRTVWRTFHWIMHRSKRTICRTFEATDWRSERSRRWKEINCGRHRERGERVVLMFVKLCLFCFTACSTSAGAPQRMIWHDPGYRGVVLTSLENRGFYFHQLRWYSAATSAIRFRVVCVTRFQAHRNTKCKWFTSAISKWRNPEPLPGLELRRTQITDDNKSVP